MRRLKSAASAAVILAMLSSCGGESGGQVTAAPPASPSPSSPSPSTPSPTGGTCSLSERKAWALSQLNEWYLFPELLDTSVNAGAYSTLQAYVDALVAPARAAGKDRYFTYVTSIAEEEAYYSTGSSAGFGFRTRIDGSRVFLEEVFESAPAAGKVSRGTEIIAIGTSSSNLRSVASIIASQGASGIYDALGPSDAGISRTLEIDNSMGGPDQPNEIVTLTKAEYSLQAVSPVYGTKTLRTPAGEEVGYVNLRTFIDNASTPLVNAFADWRSRGINKVVLDFRYNGGGLVSVADQIGDLHARTLGGQVFSYTTYRSSKSGFNETDRYTALTQSIAPMRVAIIGTGSTASASELVANSFPPYLDANVALVGENTYGKPVGQIAEDRAACDDRLRIIAFKKENADRQGEYFNGLAGTMPVFCPREDDLFEPLGSADEAMTAEALAFLDGGAPACSAPRTNGSNVRALSMSAEPVAMPRNPTPAQRENPGLF